MKDAIIAIAFVVLVVAGFWWTRGSGSGLPGGLYDPPRQDLAQRYSELGDPMPPTGELPEDRERE